MVRRHTRVDPQVVHEVIGDGAIATGSVAGGRMIPVLLIDATKRPELMELVRLHRHFPQGDCDSTWGRLRGDVALILRFQRPVVTTAVVKFGLPRYAGAVDLALASRAVYLQHGQAGDKISTTFERDRVLIELPSTGFEVIWERIHRKTLRRAFRERGVLPWKAARAADEAIHEMRRLQSVVMRPDGTDGSSLPPPLTDCDANDGNRN